MPLFVWRIPFSSPNLQQTNSDFSVKQASKLATKLSFKIALKSPLKTNVRNALSTKTAKKFIFLFRVDDKYRETYRNSCRHCRSAQADCQTRCRCRSSATRSSSSPGTGHGWHEAHSK